MNSVVNGFKTKKIKTTTLGERLRLARLRRSRELHDVEETTKVRTRYIEALENDDFASLPAQVYTIGFLERYCDYLQLSKDKYITEFSRALAAWQSMQQDTLTPKLSVHEPKLIITPRLLFSSIAGLVVIIMVGYIWIQVSRLAAPPELIIITPSQDTRVAIETIEVSGKTDPGASVEINHQHIAQDRNGNFKEIIALDTGVNTLEVVATNRFQKQNVKTLQILRTQPGQTHQPSQQTSASIGV